MKISPSILGLLIAVTSVLSPWAGAAEPEMRSYDPLIAKGDPGYSKTSESDGAGGYVQHTYFTDSSGARHLVEIQKFGKNHRSIPYYHWVSTAGPNGTTIKLTETFNYANEATTLTKEIIGRDGSTTTFRWDGQRWAYVSYKQPESNGVRNALQGLGGIGLEIGGVHVGPGGHEHGGDHLVTDHKSTDKKHTVTDKHHADDQR